MTEDINKIYKRRVIMDVMNVEQAQIAEAAGSVL